MQKRKKVKIVVDTNLWISFIISNRLNQLEALLSSGQLRLLFSTELVAEIQDTISKPKLKKFFTGYAIEEMLVAFEPFIDFIDVKSEIEACRDPKDNFLLALAKDGQADYLITGDKDLLVLKKFRKAKVITYPEFISKMSK